MSDHEKNLEEYLKADRLGKFFYVGQFELSSDSAASTVSRWNAATLYAHLLLWKPMLHTLVNHGHWSAFAITLMRDEHPVVGKDRWTLPYENLCEEYNRGIPELLANLPDEDLDPKARQPLTIDDIKRLYEFCQTGIGKRVAPLTCDQKPNFDLI